MDNSEHYDIPAIFMDCRLNWTEYASQNCLAARRRLLPHVQVRNSAAANVVDAGIDDALALDFD